MTDPRAKLIRVLRAAASGELAAIHAYDGHWRSLKPGEERERVKAIQDEERHHRRLVLQLLEDFGAKPSAKRELVFWCIGRSISMLCRVGGWFIPMYGAGKLERSNIVEYEDAARYAEECGRADLIDCLLTMAEVEWEHEKFFRESVSGHWLLRLLPLWDPPPPKEDIRAVRRRLAA
ncbi:MAG TPA: ferritin-like domain-containing protein [Thermoanaerobaculia bacterium]|nr:ferritin-like domain-containing protein [Thermoanaerobaculia bacterium]